MSGPAIGPNSPATVANDTSIGTIDWLNPANASQLDGVFASTPVLGPSQMSHGLAASGFGFTLPSGKQPSGVYVEMTRQAGGTVPSYIQDWGITLFKAGSPVSAGVNPATGWTGTLETVSFGGANSKFGTTLTATDVAHPGFGFRNVARNWTNQNAGPAHVDAIRMWIIYDAQNTSSAALPTQASTLSGSASWTNPANAAIEDGSTASVTLSGNTVSNALGSGAHGFTVPADAWVRGVQLDVRRRATTGLGIEDGLVYLRVNNALTPPNHALTGDWPTSLTSVTYGSATDLWGKPFTTPSDVNADTFGAHLVAGFSGTGGNDTAHVDSIKLTVTYCPHP